MTTSLKRFFSNDLAKKDYKLLLIIMLLIGTSVSFGLPFITLFLTQSLGASDATAGLFFLTSVAGPPINLFVGRLSDRSSRRAPFIWASALWLAVGWSIMSLAPGKLAVFAVGVIFLSFIGVLNAQIFAVLSDVVEREQETKASTVTSAIRTAYSFGWALGPVLGSFVAAWLGYRAVFLLAAGLILCALIPISRLNFRRATQVYPDDKKAGGEQGAALGLLLFGVVCALVLTGETVRQAYLPILAVERLNISLSQFGVIMSVAPLTELFLMPLAGILADRFGLTRILLSGFVIGGLGFLVFATTNGAGQLYVGQIINAYFISVIFGLGVTYAQALSPRSAGLASSVFFSAQSLSLLLGSVIGSIGVQILGLPHLFALPATACGLACLLFLYINRAD
jgi:SET family sugar efflux transporter-like MFS transporter